MRPERPSLTAAIVSFGRGVGLSEARRDPHARDLLSGPFRLALSAVQGSRSLRNVARIATGGLVDHATLRMAAVDDAVRDAAGDAIDQLVILGAGLDARPWRMKELAGVHVLEIDHPATQAYKRERIGAVRPCCQSHTFVAVDFEKDALGERLDAQALDVERPIHWLWEAVSMYLLPDAIDATLAEIGARSAPGSRLTMTYIRPDFLPFHRPKRLAHAAFSILGEPLVGTMSSDDLSGRLSRVGLSLREDSDSTDWARRYGGSALVASPFRAERLAVAERRH